SGKYRLSSTVVRVKPPHLTTSGKLFSRCSCFISRIKPAATTPANKPSSRIKGTSSSECISSAGTSKAVALPNTTRLTMAPATDARIMGIKPRMLYSSSTTSMAKITPAMGVLKEAEMALAVIGEAGSLGQLAGGAGPQVTGRPFSSAAVATDNGNHGGQPLQQHIAAWHIALMQLHTLQHMGNANAALRRRQALEDNDQQHAATQQ